MATCYHKYVGIPCPPTSSQDALPQEDLFDWTPVWDDRAEMDIDLGSRVEAVIGSDHNMLAKRDVPNQHPIKAITNLEYELSKKMDGGGFLTNMEIQAILES